MVVATDARYNMNLPNKKPFMWIEHEEVIKLTEDDAIRVIAFGAYNAMGIIGTEKGGVAIVHDDPNFVIATKDIPWSMLKRKIEFEAVVKLLRELLDDRPEHGGVGSRRALVSACTVRDYDVRTDN